MNKNERKSIQKGRDEKEPYEQMSSACENHHRSAAEGPGLEINK